MHERKSYDVGLERAINAVGSIYRLAQLLDIQPSAIRKWRRVPDHRIVEIEQKVGVPREQLRPDLYR
jgi:DNA-binding transcriptional regulator YdaS (Cro superfamily)